MSAARTLAAVVVAFACCAESPAPEALTGEQILARAKAVFRAHERPKYVVYTLVRRDTHNAVPDLANSYTLKIWCRTTDRSALTRFVWNGAAYGPMENIVVGFDGVVDPGPPTADVFERALYARASRPPEPLPAGTDLQTIGSVRVEADFDYRVRRVVRDADAWHLALDPVRDPQRNRIDDLWVDAATFEIRRLRVRDHLYLGLSGPAIDDEFDVAFVMRDGLPLIASIRGETPGGEYRTNYAFAAVTFPEALPPWYFEPNSYGAHRAEAPT
jgi:hypothetical protein